MNLDDLDIHQVGDSIQLAGALYQDRDRRTLLCFFHDQATDLPTEVLRMDLEDWKKFIRQTDLLEVPKLTKTPEDKVVKAIIRKCQRKVDQRVSWAVYRRDNYACRYCGADDLPLTVDHLVRWEEGGPSIEANLVAACKKCNTVRGDTEYNAWLRSQDYARRSRKLAGVVHQRNREIADTLPNIPRVINKRSR